MRDDRPHLIKVWPEKIALHRATTRVHPVYIAAVGVDLAIVRNQAERVSQTPAWEGVGRETLVHKAKSRDAVRITQIIVETTNLLTQQEPFVDDGAAGKARHVKVGEARQIVLFLKLGERVLHLLANHEELALKRVLILAIVAFADDRLLDHGHRIDHRLAKPVHRDRHIAPTKEDLTFFRGKLLKLLSDKGARGLVLRHKAHGDAVFASRWQGHLMGARPFAHDRIGDLHKQAGTIAQKRVGADSTAVVNPLQNLKRLLDNGMTFLALDVGDHTYSAGVMFIYRVVKTLGIWVSHGEVPICQMPLLRALCALGARSGVFLGPTRLWRAVSVTEPIADGISILQPRREKYYFAGDQNLVVLCTSACVKRVNSIGSRLLAANQAAPRSCCKRSSAPRNSPSV